MRIVFAGTPEFSVPTLQALVHAGHDVALVVTQPDRPAGRGRHLQASHVKAFAIEHHLSVFQPEEINHPESLGMIRYVAADAMVVQAFGQKLSGELLALPRLGCFNVHASLLPAYRGAAPINYAIVRGEEQTGITFMRMARKIDAGEILAQEPVAIAPDWTAGELTNALAAVGARLAVRALKDIEAGRALPIAQDVSKVSLAPKLGKNDGLVPWEKSAREVHNHIRGMTPWPGAFTFLPDGRTGHTLRVAVLRGTPAEGASGEPGAVISADHRGIVVACGSGAIRLERVKPAGGREMSADDFARGHDVRSAMRFTSHE